MQGGQKRLLLGDCRKGFVHVCDLLLESRCPASLHLSNLLERVTSKTQQENGNFSYSSIYQRHRIQNGKSSRHTPLGALLPFRPTPPLSPKYHHPDLQTMYEGIWTNIIQILPGVEHANVKFRSHGHILVFNLHKMTTALVPAASIRYVNDYLRPMEDGNETTRRGGVSRFPRSVGHWRDVPS